MTKDTLENKVDGVEDQMACQAETAAEAEPCERACPSEEVVDAIIRKRVYGAIGIGFVPVPLVDFLGLSPPSRLSLSTHWPRLTALNSKKNASNPSFLRSAAVF